MLMRTNQPTQNLLSEVDGQYIQPNQTQSIVNAVRRVQYKSVIVNRVDAGNTGNISNIVNLAMSKSKLVSTFKSGLIVLKILPTSMSIVDTVVNSNILSISRHPKAHSQHM